MVVLKDGSTWDTHGGKTPAPSSNTSSNNNSNSQPSESSQLKSYQDADGNTVYVKDGQTVGTVNKNDNYTKQVNDYVAIQTGTYGKVSVPTSVGIKALNEANSAANRGTIQEGAAASLVKYFESGKGNYGEEAKPQIVRYLEENKQSGRNVRTVLDMSPAERKAAGVEYSPRTNVVKAQEEGQYLELEDGSRLYVSEGFANKFEQAQAKLNQPEPNILREVTKEQQNKRFSGGFFSDVFDLLDIPQSQIIGALRPGVTPKEALEYRQTFRDVVENPYAGVALDIVADPLNLVGVGLLTKAGKLRKAEKVAETLSDINKIEKTIEIGQDLNKIEKALAAGQDINKLRVVEETGKVIKVENAITDLAGLQAANEVRNVKKVSNIIEAEQAAINAAQALNVVEKTSTVKKLTKAGTTIVKATAAGAIESELARQGTILASKLTANEEQSNLVNAENFNKDYAAALAEMQNSVNDQGLIRQLAFNINPELADKKTKEAFRSYLRSQGYSDAQIKVFERELAFRSTGEALTLINIGRLGEKTGQKLVGEVFKDETQLILKKKGGLALFGKVFTPIAAAGVVEGTAGEFAQERFREQELSLQNIGLGGGFGAASAGIIGGSIAGTAVNRRGTSKILEYLSYFSDPFEKPGDIAADIERRLVQKVTKKEIPIPVITIIPNQNEKGNDFLQLNLLPESQTKSKLPKVQTPVNPFVEQPQPAQNKRKSFAELLGIKQKGNVPVNPFVNTPTNTPTKTNVPVNPFVNVPTNQNVLVNPFVNTPTNTPTNVPTRTNIPTDIPVNVPTNVPVTTNIPVPVITPLAKLPPPVPFMLPFGEGYGSSRVGKKAKYVNELAIGLDLLNQSFGTGFGIKAPSTYAKQTKKKKGKK